MGQALVLISFCKQMGRTRIWTVCGFQGHAAVNHFCWFSSKPHGAPETAKRTYSFFSSVLLSLPPSFLSPLTLARPPSLSLPSSFLPPRKHAFAPAHRSAMLLLAVSPGQDGMDSRASISQSATTPINLNLSPKIISQL